MTLYEKKAKPVREQMQNPDISFAANRLTDSTHGLHRAAPNLSQSVQTLGSRMTNYLYDKMPKPSQELVGDREYQPSQSHQRDWLSLHDVLSDPLSVLDHVKNGQVQQSHVDALNEVHPELLQEMRQQVMQHMQADVVQKLPISTKRSLGIFLGSPISSSMTPEAISSNQAVYLTKPQAQAAASQNASKTTLGGLKELKIANRSETETAPLEEEE